MVGTNCEEKFTEKERGAYDGILEDYLKVAVHPDDRETISILTRHSFAFAVFPIFSSAIAVIPIIPFIGVRIS